MEEIATHRFVTVDDKREAWDRRISAEWTQALKSNQSLTAKRKADMEVTVRQHNAAASLIQNVWKRKRLYKTAVKQSMEEARVAFVKGLHSQAADVMQHQAKMKRREANDLRRRLKMSMKDWDGHDIAYARDGSQTAVPLAGIPEEDSAGRRVGGAAGGDDGSSGSGSQEDSDSGSSLGGDSPAARRSRIQQARSRATASGDGSKAAAKDKGRGRFVQRGKKAINMARLMRLAAPKQPVDLESLRVKRAMAPVWKGSGAFHNKLASNPFEAKGAGFMGVPPVEFERAPDFNRQESLGSFYTSLTKYIPRTYHWQTLRKGMHDRQTMHRLQRLKMLSRASLRRIRATHSLKASLDKALANFAVRAAGSVLRSATASWIRQQASCDDIFCSPRLANLSRLRLWVASKWRPSPLWR